MPLIIDTYNVLHTVGILPPDLAGIEVSGLIGLLKRSRFRSEKITLVCDGKPAAPLEPDPSILIRYSGSGKPADDLIGQLVRASTAPRRLLVVSSDHQVQRTARKRKCRILNSEEFLTQLAEDANLPKAAVPPPSVRAGDMTDDQIDRWVKIFDLEPDLIELQSQAALAEDSAARARPATEAQDVEDQASDDDQQVAELPPGPVLPQTLIEQAELIWRKSQQPEARE